LLKGRYRGQIIKKEGYIREAFRRHHDCVFWRLFCFLGGCIKSGMSKDNKKDFGKIEAHRNSFLLNLISIGGLYMGKHIRLCQPSS
jgi:hypothetical protein